MSDQVASSQQSSIDKHSDSGKTAISFSQVSVGGAHGVIKRKAILWKELQGGVLIEKGSWQGGVSIEMDF